MSRRRPIAAGFGQDSQSASLDRQVTASTESGMLNLSSRSLTAVPDSVYAQTDLVKLTLAHNRIETLRDPLEFWVLRSLDLTDNALSAIPETIKHCVELRSLVASSNRIGAIPDSLSLLEELKILELDDNHLTELPLHMNPTLVSLTLGNNRFCEVPPGIMDLHNLTEIRLGGNSLTAVPQSGWERLSQLKKIDLSRNRIESMPSLAGARSLTDIDVSSNRLHTMGRLPNSVVKVNLTRNSLRDVPEAVLLLTSSLVELYLSQNRIREIPAAIAGLEKLERLEMAECGLAVVPSTIGLMHALIHLDLRLNDLSSLPAELGLCENLKVLSLDQNPLRTIRRDVIERGIKGLKEYLRTRLPQGGVVAEDAATRASRLGTTVGKLDLPNSGLTEIVPAAMFSSLDPASVTVVDLSRNRICVVPNAWLSLLTSIRVLNMAHNPITALPNEFDACTALAELDLSHTKVTSLPPSLGNCRALARLNVQACRGMNIGAEFVGAWPKLAEIDVSFCQLSAIPPPIASGSLPSLRQADLSNNGIREVADSVANLMSLEILNLSNNDITRLPPAIGSMTRITSLPLDGNPLRQPRLAVAQKGTAAVLEWLRSRM